MSESSPIVEQGGRRDSAAEDESTPLISFRNPFRIGSPWRSSLPYHHQYPRSRSISPYSETDDDVDIDSLQLSLARAASISSSVGLGPGTGVPQWNRDRTRPSNIVKADVQSVLPSDVVVGISEVQGLQDEGNNEEEESMFIGITSPKFWLVFGCVMLVYFVGCFDSTLMASAHPVITSYFDASQSASWLSTVFLISSTAFQPLF